MTTNRRTIRTVILLGIALITAGCQTTRQGSNTYTRSEAQRPLTVNYATVLNVMPVTIETEETGAGAVVGGVAGGVAGSTIGDGDGQTLATVAGAIVGAAVGSATEKALGRQDAIEIELETDDGELLVVVQEADVMFYPGDRVRLVESSYGKLRVRP